MQIDKWTADAKSGESANNTNFSVWIDPVVPQPISASYFPLEQGLQDGSAEQSSHLNQADSLSSGSLTHSAEVVMVRPRYPHTYTLTENSDVTRMPTRPQPTIWQYESPQYAAESSLSSLSLVVPELAAKDNERRYVTPHPDVDIAEIETLPPPKRSGKGPKKTQQLRVQAIDELDTVPPHAPTVRVPLFDRPKNLPTLRPTAAVDGGGNPWTVGPGANSAFAKRIASAERNPRRRISYGLNPLDKLRWWLLFPGRIEFLLWFSGTITLMAVTCIFLFVTVISFGWMTAGNSASVNNGTAPARVGTTITTACAKNNKHCHSSQTPGKANLSLKLLTGGALIAGLPVDLQGEGFSAKGMVKLTHDTNEACSPDSTQADEHGVFNVSIQLGIGPEWAPGQHIITAYDTVSKHSAQTTLLIYSSPYGKSGTPAPVTASGASPTPGNNGGNGNGGGQNPNPLPTPVNQPPATPTVGMSPTAVPTQSQPTPTATTAPKPSPTTAPKPKPTVGVTPTAGTKKVISDSSAANGIQVISLKEANSTPALNLSSSKWLWLVLLGYALSMLLLGVAGIMHHKHRK